jgi:propionate catabolism operon transcriptional regulator
VELISVSPVMRQVVEEADLVTKYGVSAMLVTGESGVGKEHLARFVHGRDRRTKGPLVVVRCRPASGPDAADGGVREERSLTAALNQASGGTLLLKEVQYLTPPQQTELLEWTDAACRESRARRVRIICSGAPSLFDDVRAGRFSSTLYYRLNVVHVQVPPLRQRPDDLEPLLRHFMTESARRQNVALPPFEEMWRHALRRHQWPRNAHELRELAESLVARRTPFPLFPRA